MAVGRIGARKHRRDRLSIFSLRTPRLEKGETWGTRASIGLLQLQCQRWEVEILDFRGPTVAFLDCMSSGECA